MDEWKGVDRTRHAAIGPLAFGAAMLLSLPLMYVAIPGIVDPDGWVPVEPVVLVSKGPESRISPSWYKVHTDFAAVYTPADANPELLHRLMDIMARKAEALGEDPAVLRNCIRACYSGGTSGAMDKIPCFAEKNLRNGQAVWIIAFNWAMSLERHLTHFRICYVSIPDITIVHTESCG